MSRFRRCIKSRKGPALSPIFDQPVQAWAGNRGFARYGLKQIASLLSWSEASNHEVCVPNYTCQMTAIDDDYFAMQAWLAGHLGSRVVAVGGFYEESNAPEIYFSAHFFDFSGTWAMVTAGHCLKDFVANPPKLTLVFDTTSPTNAPLPIRLEPEKIVAVYDEQTGIDYGFVPILELYQVGLIDGGVVPCSLESVAPAETIFDYYFLIGHPGEHSSFAEAADGLVIQAPQTVLTLDRLDERDVEGFSRLEFRCDLSPIEGVPNLDKIQGMSGGLIVGVKGAPSQAARWGVLGLQSTWTPRLNILRACPHDAFFKVLASRMRSEA